jgi:hypothetical protein
MTRIQRQMLLWQIAEINHTLTHELKRYCVLPTSYVRDEIFRLREKRAQLETKLGFPNV